MQFLIILIIKTSTLAAIAPGESVSGIIVFAKEAIKDCLASKFDNLGVQYNLNRLYPEKLKTLTPLKKNIL